MENGSLTNFWFVRSRNWFAIHESQALNSYSNKECTRNVHQIRTHIQKMYKLYKTCTHFRLKMDWNLKCMFFVYKINVQTGSLHAKWCKPGHDPSQNLIKICQVVTIYKIW